MVSTVAGTAAVQWCVAESDIAMHPRSATSCSTARLEALGYEVILFHASGVGGKSLERLACSGELAGVVDVTTHELADLVVDGICSAADARLTGAGAAGAFADACVDAFVEIAKT